MRFDDFTRRQFIACGGAFLIPGSDSARTRSFWVLQLLRPSCLIVHPIGAARLHCSSAEENWILEGSQAVSIISVSANVRITGPASQPVEFMLEIPNVIRRRYFGTLHIATQERLIIPVVSMDCETATASIVEAELPTSGCPAQALAAQAVVSRSIVCAATEPRHRCADFCDTTHCQFLRSPSAPGSKTAEVVDATKELVLYDRGSILPARYSAACGGTTEAAMDGNHQYVPVACEICRKRRIARRGHGVGLCQEGAMGLARLGWGWQAILAKFYPNATIDQIPATAGSKRL